MFKEDAKEAAPLASRAMRNLLAAAPTRGMTGADLRTAVGDFVVKAEMLLQKDEAGPAILKCFDAAIDAGITHRQLAHVRELAALEITVLLGATLTKDAIIGFCLTYECQVIAGMTFKSRQDVSALRKEMNTAFDAMEEIAADDMDAMTYRAVVALHAALNLHLIETARPLPRMIQYQFADVLSSLVIGHRLYDDAGRADELRDENKTIHPAFSQRQGIALSA